MHCQTQTYYCLPSPLDEPVKVWSKWKGNCIKHKEKYTLNGYITHTRRITLRVCTILGWRLLCKKTNFISLYVHVYIQTYLSIYTSGLCLIKQGRALCGRDDSTTNGALLKPHSFIRFHTVCGTHCSLLQMGAVCGHCLNQPFAFYWADHWKLQSDDKGACMLDFLLTCQVQVIKSLAREWHTFRALCWQRFLFSCPWLFITSMVPAVLLLILYLKIPFKL